MRRLLMLVALLVLSAPPALAAGGRLFLGWGNCVGSGGAGSGSFDCVNGLGGTLYADYELNTAATSVVVLDAIVDVLINGAAAVPAFWHFETGGCNEYYLLLSARRSPGRCAGDAVTLCLSGGGACSQYIIAYGPEYPIPGRARILVSLARNFSSPVTLNAAPTRQFGFTLEIDATNATEAGGPCAGCTAVAGIRLSAIVLESYPANAGSEGIVDIITNDMAGSLPDVCLNSTNCLQVPVRNRTWGQLKALYR